MSNVWECLHFATLELVRSTPIKHRLVGAYRRHLVEIREEHLPREIRETFLRVMNSLRCVRPLPGEDEVAASVRKMSAIEADECASAIVEMFGAMSGAVANFQRVTGTVVALHAEVPSLIASVNRA